jgi:hypothetical protein
MDTRIAIQAGAPASAAPQPPASDKLTALRTALLSAQAANQGRLPLDDSTLAGTAAAALPGLLAAQFQTSAFTLASGIVLSDVNANMFSVDGQGSLHDMALSLLVRFTDNQGEIEMQALFYTTVYTELAKALPSLPADFFKAVSGAGLNPTVNLPSGLPSDVAFGQASYGAAAYLYPGQGYPVSYLAPQLQGTVNIAQGVQRSLYLELPTASSGWRILSPEADSWTFTDLAWLLPQAQLASSFPAIIPAEQVELAYFQLHLTPAAPTFSALYLTVHNKTDPSAPLWSACQGKVRLSLVTVAMNLSASAATVTCAGTGWIRGAFALGQAFLYAEIPYPLGSGAWSIDSYPNLTLLGGLDDLAELLPGGGALSTLLPAGLDTVLNAFELSHLYIAVDPAQMALQRFLFEVSTTNPWPLVPGVLQLDKLTVQFSVDSAGGLTGGVQCQFELGQGNVVYVSFQRYDAGGNWYFVVNSPVIALPSLGQLATLANSTDLSSYLQASGLGKLAFLMYDLNIGVTLGQQNKLTNLGLTLQLANSGDSKSPQLDWEVIPNVLTLRNFRVGFQLNWKPGLVADVTGFFTLNTLDFAMKFGRGPQGDAFIGAYSPSAAAGKQSVDVQALIQTISPSVAALVPAGLEVALDDTFIAYVNVGGKGKKFILALDVTIEIPLTGIPLIGDVLADSAKVEIQDLKVVVASDALDADEVAAVNALIGGLPADMSVKPLPAPQAGQTGAIIPSGFSMVAKLAIGTLELLISAPATAPPRNAPAPGQDALLPALAAPGSALLAAADPASNYQSTMWINVQKSFGPVSLQKIGFNYHDGKVYVLLNAALNTGGLAIELLGFGIGSPLGKPALSFDIDGLALSYASGPLTIAGGMLGTLQPEVDFAGTLIIEAEAFNLAAFGGYATVEGQPSFFLYALMNEPPLGGPPAFFMTGVAAGFGFNRSLLIPAIDQVYSFPFVSWAAKPGTAPSMDPGKSIGDQVAAAISQLSGQGVVAPKVGAYWLAGGLTFTTYEILSSFALLTVTFGNDFELDLLGLSTLSMPPAVDNPVAEVQLEIKVSFAPSAGLFSLAAQLTPNSYVFSRQCQLTGGFAFYYWFAKQNAGDFVVSLGGYNSNFTVPAYYPSVPRLGMNWRLSDQLSITGELYFALTNNVVMAGGKLSAVWESGPVRAWFLVWADFLMVFKPLHYYISAGIDLGASFTIKLLFVRISITIHLGVSLECWGPEFSGTARVNLSIISFTVHFGGEPSQPANKLEWGDFVGQLLPSATPATSQRLLADAAPANLPSLVHVTINQGLISKLGGTSFLVDGESFSCSVRTVIPTKITQLGGVLSLAPDAQQPHDAHGNLILPNVDFGAGPSQISPADFQPTLSITMATTEESRFLAVRNFADAPKALWEVKQFDAHGVPQTDPSTALTAPSVTNTLKGYDLVAHVTPPDHPLPIPKETLEYTADEQIQHFAWSSPTFASSDPFSKQTVAATILSTPAVQVRSALLAAMLAQALAVDASVDVAGLAVAGSNDLMAEPLLRLLGEQRTAALA